MGEVDITICLKKIKKDLKNINRFIAKLEN